MSGRHLAAAVALLLALGSSAAAQDAVVEGPGYKVGEGSVLHLLLGAQSGVVSNVFYEEDSGRTAGLIHLQTSLDLATLPPERLGETDGLGEADGNPPTAPPKAEFRLGLGLDYREYLSTAPKVRAQRDLGVDFHGTYEGNPAGKLGFIIDDQFIRAIAPRNFESPESLDRDINHATAGIIYRPGGGALEIGGRFENIVDVFESSQSSFANRMHNLIGLRAEWQFLPITRFSFDGSFGFFGGLGAASTKVSSLPLRLQLGVATLITQQFSVRARAGFGKGWYAEGPDFTGALVAAELGIRYSPVGRVLLSYQHDYKDSINANFYGEHQARLALNQQIQRVLVTAGIEGRLRTYEGIPMEVVPVGMDTTRTDIIFAVTAAARYVIRDRYSLTGDYRLSSVQTDFRYVADNVPSEDPSFVRHELMFGARAAF